MIAMHKKLLSVIRDDLVKMLSKTQESQDCSDNYLLKKIFKNHRYNKTTNQHHGIRLSTLGNQLLRKHYQAYDYVIDHKVSNKSLLLMDQHMTWPYYVGRTRVSFYSENDAAWFSLNGKNLDDYADYL
jgi:hypothetical protein